MRRLTPRDRRKINVSKLAFELVRHHEHYKAVINAVITVTLTAALLAILVWADPLGIETTSTTSAAAKAFVLGVGVDDGSGGLT